MLAKYAKKIRAAQVYDVAIETDLDHATSLSARLGNTVLLKREDQQPVFSFKVRGAYNKMASLSEAARQQGVIAASAGNHAQGVALGAKHLKCKATIVMPRTTPSIKINAVRSHGARVVLHGDTYDDALERALVLAEEKSLTFIHPYDDPVVIAGQGTVAQELLAQADELDAVFIPVGGGGLIAGMAAWIKSERPSVKVIGVEPVDTPTLHAALAAGRRVTLKSVGLFADGVAVKQIGQHTFKVAREHVDAVVLVSVDEICAAIRDVFEDTRAIAEPAGALAVAGLKRWAIEQGASNQTLAAVVSGANINFDRLRHVAERAEVGEQREALFAVTIPEKPGSFRKFCATLGKRGITEFNYRYADNHDAHIFVGLQLADGVGEKDTLLNELRAQGYPVVDLTDDELAKTHIRYMVGGHSAEVTDERLFRVQFPERPGALMEFLRGIGTRWNISLFHYRNHGSAYGRVLVGLQVAKTERKALSASLDQLGYDYTEESENPGYDLFLGAD